MTGNTYSIGTKSYYQLVAYFHAYYEHIVCLLVLIKHIQYSERPYSTPLILPNN